LLRVDTPDAYYETLSTFYEAYVSSDSCDGTTADQRSTVLIHFKSMRRFLYHLKERKRKNPWIR
jgi:hypothetical protein